METPINYITRRTVPVMCPDTGSTPMTTFEAVEEALLMEFPSLQTSSPAVARAIQAIAYHIDDDAAELQCGMDELLDG